MTCTDQPAQPSHWPKDFVGHLRTIHFALIGACIGVILAAASVKPYNPVTAVRQVNEIIELQKLWSPNFVLNQLTDSLQRTDNSAVPPKAKNYPVCGA